MKQTLTERFWSKVDKNGGCWLWTASCYGNGYGQFFFEGRLNAAHRVSWQLTFGQIPDGLCVLHHCDNQLCVKPNHLFLGTKGENNTDMAGKGRSTHGEKNAASKLKPIEVITIRELASLGQKGVSLARLFGISEQQISNIILRRQWTRI